METLRAYFLSEGFTETEVTRITEKFKCQKLQKGNLFVQEGKLSQHLGFIQEGFLQYFINLDGEEKTIYSVSAPNFVASLVSFFKKVPARENIRATVDTLVWVLNKNDLKELQTTLPAFNHFYTNLLEWQICCIEESRLDAIMLSAQERYEKMLRKEPALLQQIPLQYLASILGVTPRHLSRIRNKIS